MSLNWQDDGRDPNDPDPTEGRGAQLLVIAGFLLSITWLLLWNLR